MKYSLNSPVAKATMTLGLFFALATANAQNSNRGGGHGGQHEKPTTEQMAERQLQQLKSSLTLTADQEASVKPIVQKYAEERAQARAAGKSDAAVSKTKMAEIDAAEDADLKAVLTAEQYQKLQTEKANRKNHTGGGNGRPQKGKGQK